MRHILFCALFLIVHQALAAEYAPATASGTQSVLVLPFAPPRGADEYRWVSQSIQHVVVADLSHGSTLKVMAPANLGRMPPDAASASSGRFSTDAA